MTQPPNQELLTIGALADRSGHRPSALRHYDAIGLLTPVTRLSKQRRYDLDAIHQLWLIALYQDVGFRLEEIRSPLPHRGSGRPPWEAIAGAKVRAPDETIRKPQAAGRPP